MKPNASRFFRFAVVVPALLGLLNSVSAAPRPWALVGSAAPFEAEYVGMVKGAVTLQGTGGVRKDFAIEKFSPEDQVFLFEMEAGNGRPFSFPKQTALTTKGGYKAGTLAKPGEKVVELGGGSELHVTEPVSLLAGGFNFTSPDAWLVFDQVPASKVSAEFLEKIRVYGSPAELGKNVRVSQYGAGAVVIPHGADFPAMTVFLAKGCTGAAMPLKCHDQEAVIEGMAVGSFRLKRGYMATIAQNKDGTGVSRNYVAQDHDLEVSSLPAGLDQGIGFLRVFPWRWTNKKGIAGGIHQGLNLGWFYDWNISTNSSADMEYVPIKQKRYWPGLNQDWKARGSLHLLGFNEPDKADQAKMSVDEAIQGWPELLKTGLRLGSPSTSDGGLNWLYQFMDKADAAGLRVDFVAVHYYRAHPNPGDAKGAAQQFHDFLKGIHERTKRPLWVTEWNNGANWTTAPDPDAKQQRDAIREMIEMLDKTPFVERYALYNWVEEVRELKRKDNSLTPAGEVYRDQVSPLGYVQEKAGR
ncbi:glycoside hydrolase family protein [Luteolibacter arcticus]|uniref:Glycoside hydrolase family protein n=1 Tax=Luteolibacter arcticus TaxID=1581411 RepID=A0ABT3GQM1_9BACT|nr:glycoside hydrolase family protein [Luteolibacter arcticus]MCW1925808.1 glycoside hydrolase family protein [Luteolibacter arcticus]